MKKNLILCGVMLALGAALGAWAMAAIQSRARQKAVDAAMKSEREQCGTIRMERDELARRAKMTELRLHLGQVAIQAGRMNYGNARTEAESVFADAASLEALVRGTADERELQMILSRKEQVMADLAVGNPASAVALEQMYAASLKGSGSR